MEELKSELIKLLETEKRNVTLKEIIDISGLPNADKIIEAMAELEKEGRIFRNKKGEFLIWYKGLNRLFGTINITSRGAGILKEENGEITFVHRRFLNGALPGDKVIINDLKVVRGRQEGKIEKVIDRYSDQLLCEVVNYGGHRELRSLYGNRDIEIKVPIEDLNKYVNGDRLLIKIGLEKEKEKYIGQIIKKICHKDDPDSDLITIALKHGFEFNFPEEVKAELKDIPIDISGEDISDRVDLRDKVIITIDGEDTKDIDDAISLDILPNGNYKLGVHIADVSHYVKKGTALFEEALKRGTSVYMLDTVIPMLPRELSNGICSLNPNEDRLTKTCEIEIDRNGNIINSKLFNSVIRSKKKMSYEYVNQILEKGIDIPEYTQFKDLLERMNDLSIKLYEKRILRGSVEFDRPEIKIKTYDDHKVSEIKVLNIDTAELLIENFMLAANECVATYFAQKELPAIYRVHDIPNIRKLNKTIDVINNIHEEIPMPKDDLNSPKTVQQFLFSLKDYKEYPSFSYMILRDMSKAEYSEENIGHFGLAMNNYTHFTSPIRRFPDLLVHTLLNYYDENSIDFIDVSSLKEEIARMADQSSDLEQAAQKAEYEANDMKLAEFMMDHIGEEYEGNITEITEKNMRITLDNLIEGVVNLGDLEPKSFYNFDKSKLCLISPEYEYHLGDRIKVVVKDATKEYRRINFIAKELVKENDNGEKQMIKNKV